MRIHTLSPPPLALFLSLVLSAAASAQVPTFEHRWSGLVFDIHAPDGPHAFTAGAAAEDTEPLNAVKLVDALPDNLFVAGQCGVMWEFSGGMWTEHRSETSSHIRHLSVLPNGRVYASAWRDKDIHSCITRLK